ncbi:MAG: iron ABC transporter permease [Flaviflexus sp.]|nr:iron ABC transporter permease [Flaviflexus sp.]
MRSWKAAGAAAVILPLAFLAAFFCYPVIAMLARGITGPGGLDVTGITAVLTERRTWRVIGQTVYQAGLGTIFSLLLGVPGAYVLYRLRFPGQRALRALAVVPFVLPTVVVGAAFRAVLGRGGPAAFLGLDQTVTAVILAMVFFNYSVVVRTVGTMWASLDPRSEEAARTLGASPARAFATVTLPRLAPAIASSGAIVFLFCSTSYGLVRTLGSPGYGTIETEIWRRSAIYLDLKAASVLSLVQVVLVLATLVVSERLSKRQALRLRGGVRVPVTPAAIAPAALTFMVIAGLICTPILTLISRSLGGSAGWSLKNYRLLATSGEGYTGGATVLDAIWNSVRQGAMATIICLAVAVPLALVMSRPTAGAARRAQSLLGGLLLLPIGVSAVTLGFGFSLALDTPPLDLRDSRLLIPIAQAIVALPLAVRALTPTLSAIAPAQREAARTLGAGPWRVLATIDGPHLARGMTIALGFAFASSLGEFGATSFLARPDTQTLPVMIVRLLGRPGSDNYGMAMAGAVVLAVLTAGIMAGAEALRKDVP